MRLQLLQQIGQPNHRFAAELVVDELGTVYVLWTDCWQHRQCLEHIVLRPNYATDALRVVREKERYLDDVLSGKAAPPRMEAASHSVTKSAVRPQALAG